MFVEPYLRSGPPFLKEHHVGFDSRVRTENIGGQPHDCMDVTLFEKMLADSRFDTFTEKKPIRQNDSRSSSTPQHIDNGHNKKVGGFTTSQRRWKFELDARFLNATKWRIG